MNNPDPIEVTSFLCRLALSEAPQAQRTFIPETDAAYWEAIAEAYRVYVEQQDKHMAEMMERFETAEKIYKLAITNLQGKIATLEGKPKKLKRWWRWS